jgi:hypothetical protein
MSKNVDLVEFVQARLAEDEAAARAARDANTGAYTITEGDAMWKADGMVSTQPHGLPVVGEEVDPDIRAHIALHDPLRVLDETEAKRQMIPLACEPPSEIDSLYGCQHSAAEIAASKCRTHPPASIKLLRLLAAPYGDHPDYRKEWRP